MRLPGVQCAGMCLCGTLIGPGSGCFAAWAVELLGSHIEAPQSAALVQIHKVLAARKFGGGAACSRGGGGIRMGCALQQQRVAVHLWAMQCSSREWNGVVLSWLTIVAVYHSLLQWVAALLS